MLEPSAGITDVAVRHRIRLLSGILLLLTAVGIARLSVGPHEFIVVEGLVLLAAVLLYALNRSRYRGATAPLLVLLLTVTITLSPLVLP